MPIIWWCIIKICFPIFSTVLLKGNILNDQETNGKSLQALSYIFEDNHVYLSIHVLSTNTSITSLDLLILQVFFNISMVEYFHMMLCCADTWSILDC